MNSGDQHRGGVADKALQLVLEMKRNPDVMPPYNTELIRQCLQKIDELFQKNAAVVEQIRAQQPHDPSLLQPRLAAMCHIRRCMMAYVNERKNRIRFYRWKYGGALPPSIRNALCDAEIQFFHEYSSTLARFQTNLSDQGVNLLLLTKPPKTLFVQVRSLEDYGEFETSDGTQVQLSKDSLHHLPRQDCEMLIRQGVLELVH
uniref:DNA replication complex GINS protein PSF1 n=1 Tax=Caenorhabditis tropicalis TaxID=1561998 RepID=A0A1I7T7U1_9PELO